MTPKGNINKLKRIGIIIAGIVSTAALFYFCKLSGFSFSIPLILLSLGFHLHYSRKSGFRFFTKLGLLLAIIVFISNSILNYTTLSVYYIPVAGIAMLTILLFSDLLVAFTMALASSLIVVLALNGDFTMWIIFFIGSVTGIYAVKDARTQNQLIAAALFVSAIQVVCLLILNHKIEFIMSNIYMKMFIWPLVANGILSIIFVTPTTLKVFEMLFGVVTNFSLQELSDFNQPLLKRMILEAPGTYHHSLIVSNLAESAADSIGAHSLLARVGAYYHDIGKLLQPEYFTENQMLGSSKHDSIEPSLSKLVIFNHVKEGIELAKKYKLNPVIIDFIPQHHGTSIMHYFYQKSLEDAQDGENIEEEHYRYPGPKPQTKEAAIVLLADSVEAATRTIDEPTPPKIEATVKKIINNKFIDGQFDECNLTLKDIEKISQTFTRILGAMYHSRVKYPEKKNGSNGHKSSEKNTSK